MQNKYQGKLTPHTKDVDMKTEVQKYQEMLESREALISATGFALDHVIEQAKLELGSLYGQQFQQTTAPAEGGSSNLQT
jgi:hypothetical protein